LGGVEADAPRLPQQLGPVHRRVGIADQVLGPIVRVATQRNTNRCGNDQLVAVYDEWLGKGSRQPVGRSKRRVRPWGAVDQHHELIAAEAGRHVAAPDTAEKTLPEFAQDPISSIVTEAVVDELEVVEIDEEERDLGTLPSGLGQ